MKLGFFNIVVLLASLFVFSSQAFALSDVNVSKAKDFMKAGMYPQAVSLLEKATKKKPTNAEAYFELGICYLQQNKIKQAGKRFSSAVKLKDDYKFKVGNEYKKYGLDKLDNGNTDKGYTLLKKAVEYQPALKQELADAFYQEGIFSIDHKYFNLAIQFDHSYKIKIYNILMDKADRMNDDACIKLYIAAYKYYTAGDVRGKKAGTRLLTISEGLEKEGAFDSEVKEFRNAAEKFIFVPSDFKVYKLGDNPTFKLKKGQTTDTYIRFADNFSYLFKHTNKKYELIFRNGKIIKKWAGETIPNQIDSDFKIRAKEDVTVTIKTTSKVHKHGKVTKKRAVETIPKQIDSDSKSRAVEDVKVTKKTKSSQPDYKIYGQGKVTKKRAVETLSKQIDSDSKSRVVEDVKFTKKTKSSQPDLKVHQQGKVTKKRAVEAIPNKIDSESKSRVVKDVKVTKKTKSSQPDLKVHQQGKVTKKRAVETLPNKTNSDSKSRAVAVANVTKKTKSSKPDYKVYKPGDSPIFKLKKGQSTDTYIRFADNFSYLFIHTNKNYELIFRDGKIVKKWAGETIPNQIDSDFKIRAVEDVTIAIKTKSPQPDYKVYKLGDNPRFELKKGQTTDTYIRFADNFSYLFKHTNKNYELIFRNGRVVKKWAGETIPNQIDSDFKIRAVEDVIVTIKTTSYQKSLVKKVEISLEKQIENLKKRQNELKKEITENLDLLTGTINRSPAMMSYGLTTKIDGETVSRYVRKGLVPVVKQMTGRHKRVNEMIKELSNINWELLMLESG